MLFLISDVFISFYASTRPVDGVGGILFSGCSSIFAYVCRHSLHMMEAFYNWLIWSYLKTIIWKQSFIWFMHAVFAMDSINKHFVAAVLMKSLHNRYFIWETASKCACTGFPKNAVIFLKNHLISHLWHSSFSMHIPVKKILIVDLLELFSVQL